MQFPHWSLSHCLTDRQLGYTCSERRVGAQILGCLEVATSCHLLNPSAIGKSREEYF